MTVAQHITVMLDIVQRPGSPRALLLGRWTESLTVPDFEILREIVIDDLRGAPGVPKLAHYGWIQSRFEPMVHPQHGTLGKWRLGVAERDSLSCAVATWTTTMRSARWCPGRTWWPTWPRLASSHGLFSYVRPESRIPKDHPLRVIRRIVDDALKTLDARFAALYAEDGRPSIPPEQLLRALLLQAFYSIRSERQLMEQLDYNLLFRWFVGIGVDDPVWVPTVFSKNRDRLLEGYIAAEFLTAVLNLPEVTALLSDEHFSVDGTLIEAWASMKSFRRKDGQDEPPGPGRNGERNFRNEKRSNETHASSTDPDARLARKSEGQEAKLAYAGHLLMENRHGLIVDARLTHATGTAEPEAALTMLQARPRRHKTVGADKAYDTANFVAKSRAAGATPHVAQNITAYRGSNIDARATPATRSARSFASASRRPMAGSRRSAAWRRPSCAASGGSSGCLS